MKRSSRVYSSNPQNTAVLTVDFLKGYIKDVPDVDNEVVQLLLDSAVSRFEDETNMVLLSRAMKQDFSGWWDPIIIECFPVSAITKVGYKDEDGDVQEIDSADYSAQLNKGMPEIELNITSPSLQNVPYPITIEFTAGYADANAIPKDIKLCLAQMITTGYEYRGNHVQKYPNAVDLIIQKYRKYRL